MTTSAPAQAAWPGTGPPFSSPTADLGRRSGTQATHSRPSRTRRSCAWPSTTSIGRGPSAAFMLRLLSGRRRRGRPGRGPGRGRVVEGHGGEVVLVRDVVGRDGAGNRRGVAGEEGGHVLFEAFSEVVEDSGEVAQRSATPGSPTWWDGMVPGIELSTVYLKKTSITAAWATTRPTGPHPLSPPVVQRDLFGLFASSGGRTARRAGVGSGAPAARPSGDAAGDRRLRHRPHRSPSRRAALGTGRPGGGGHHRRAGRYRARLLRDGVMTGGSDLSHLYPPGPPQRAAEARIWEALASRKDAHPVDRTAAAAATVLVPALPRAPAEAKEFTVRAVSELAAGERAIIQWLDLGAGFPALDGSDVRDLAWQATMSLASQARLKFLTMAACRAAGGSGVRGTRRRRRAEEASWRQAAGVRPTMPATSANGSGRRRAGRRRRVRPASSPPGRRGRPW